MSKNNKIGKLQVDEELSMEDTQVGQSNEGINMINNSNGKWQFKKFLKPTIKNAITILTIAALLLIIIFLFKVIFAGPSDRVNSDVVKQSSSAKQNSEA